MKQKSMLFWPGRGKNPDVLNYFLTHIRGKGVAVEVIPFEYDTGSPPFSVDSAWSAWLREYPVPWWAGISLGASLAWLFASLPDDSIKPKRITLINPFASRKQLAEEKRFPLDGQWDFSPVDHGVTLHAAEVVISVFDEKIPAHHGIRLLNRLNAEAKRVIFVNDNHQIQNRDVQEELAGVLSAIPEEVYRGTTHYCNIYQQA